MKQMRKVLLCCIPLLVLHSTVLSARADQGKELFDKQCASCHTIGGGDSGGPDLKSVGGKRSAVWLERVIAEPEKLTAEKDPVQLGLVKQYGYEMPNLGLSRDEARKLVAYLQGGSASAKLTGGAPAKAEPFAASAGKGAETSQLAAEPAGEPVKKVEIVVTPQLVETGKSLFSGEIRFSKGGAPCIACHDLRYPGLQGGNLAADLSGIYKGMGEAGMKGVLKALKFPTMKKIYADKQLTDDEITALIVFAKDAAEKNAEVRNNSTLAGGALLFVAIFIGLAFYKRRIG